MSSFFEYLYEVTPDLFSTSQSSSTGFHSVKEPATKTGGVVELFEKETVTETMLKNGSAVELIRHRDDRSFVWVFGC